MTARESLRLFAPGAFRRMIVLGLDRRTISLCRFARESRIDVIVVTGPRQLDAASEWGATKSLSDLGVELTVRNALADDDPIFAAREDTLIFSVSSPFIVRSWLIERFGGRVVNSHGTRLPEWRGGGGYSWQIMAGDRGGNSLVHLITPGIDNGPVVYERRYEFPGHLRRPNEYIEHAAKMDHECLGTFLAKITEGFSFPLRFQDESVSTSTRG